MSVKFTVVHRKDINNVGDMASNPLQYFLKPDEYQVVDITKLGYENFDTGIPIVAGGGGLISNEFFGDVLADLLLGADRKKLLTMWADFWEISDPINVDLRIEFTKKARELIKEYLSKLHPSNTPRILWGAGHNQDTNKRVKKIEYPEYLVDFDHIGIRDHGQKFQWVPCASCMHPALRKSYSIKNKVIWFEHKKQLIKSSDFGGDPIPRFVNSGDNIEQTIELLGSSEIILTNSYHGAYWGTLLGKKVIVDNAWSSKFYTMRHTPLILEKGEYWRDAIDAAKIYPNALDECIGANQRFWNEVQGCTQ